MIALLLPPLNPQPAPAVQPEPAAARTNAEPEERAESAPFRAALTDAQRDPRERDIADRAAQDATLYGRDVSVSAIAAGELRSRTDSPAGAEQTGASAQPQNASGRTGHTSDGSAGGHASSQGKSSGAARTVDGGEQTSAAQQMAGEKSPNAQPVPRADQAPQSTEIGQAGVASKAAVNQVGAMSTSQAVSAAARVDALKPLTAMSTVRSGAESAVRGAEVARGGAAVTTKTAAKQPRLKADEPEPLAQLVGRGLAAAIRQKNGSVMMALKPEALGPVRIRVQIEDAAVAARFQVSTASARDLLSEQLDTLKSAMESRGLKVDRLIVELVPELRREDAHRSEPGTQTPGKDAAADGQLERDADAHGGAGGERSGNRDAATGVPAEPDGQDAQSLNSSAWGARTRPEHADDEGWSVLRIDAVA